MHSASRINEGQEPENRAHAGFPAGFTAGSESRPLALVRGVEAKSAPAAAAGAPATDCGGAAHDGQNKSVHTRERFRGARVGFRLAQNVQIAQKDRRHR
jgi:hypothetical protein